MGLKYVYDYGYDHASSYFHPMADEGLNDIGLILSIPMPSRGSYNNTILQNACLSYLLLLNNSIPFLDIGLEAELKAFVDNLLRFTGTDEINSIVKADMILSLKISSVALNL